MAVSAMECSLAKSSAPSSIRKHPLTFCFIFLTPRSLALSQLLDNASEASIRVLKVKSKVSGGFRTDEGANEFACFHSIAETAKRNGISKLNALYQLISDMAPQSNFFERMFSKEG